MKRGFGVLGSGNDGCGGSKVSECLTTLPVARVLDEIRSLLNES
jgi:hypothetical protein